MSSVARASMALLLATLTLYVIATAASALRSISIIGGPRTVHANSRAMTFTEEEGNFRVICEDSYELRWTSSIPKIVGGFAADGTYVAPRCMGGNKRPLTANQPWPLAFVSFAGTLPNVTSIRLSFKRVEVLVEAFFGIARCLYSGEVQFTSGGGTNRITELRADESRLLPLASEALSGATCPRNGIFRGTLTVSPSTEIRLL
jgi:hypothetical protein